MIIGEDEEELGQPSFELVAGSSVSDLKNREMKNRETESNKMDETTYRGKIKNWNNETDKSNEGDEGKQEKQKRKIEVHLEIGGE